MEDYWFVVHDLMAYNQHQDMICCKAKTMEFNRKRPMRMFFKKMQIGDQFVYYAAASYAIVGIFKIKSHAEYYSDSVWPDVFVRQIEPYIMPPKGKYLDIKKILFEDSNEFDIFPDKEKWSLSLWGKTVKKLSESDFDIFRRNIDNKKYLVSEDDVRVPITMWQKSVGNKKTG